jgi:hypothetical protein
MSEYGNPDLPAEWAYISKYFRTLRGITFLSSSRKVGEMGVCDTLRTI